MKRSSPIRISGPLGISRIPVASTTIDAGPASRKAGIPFDHRVGDKAVVGGPPRHHRRHPGALFERDRSDLDRREQPRGFGFGAGRDPAVFRFKLDAFRWPPHR